MVDLNIIARRSCEVASKRAAFDPSKLNTNSVKQIDPDELPATNPMLAMPPIPL